VRFEPARVELEAIHPESNVILRRVGWKEFFENFDGHNVEFMREFSQSFDGE